MLTNRGTRRIANAAAAAAALAAAAKENMGGNKHAKKKKRGAAAKGSLLSELRGSVVPLQDLCINLVCANIDLVDALGDVGDSVRDALCALLCRHRKLDERVLRLFLGQDTSCLRLYDCADLDPPDLDAIAPTCPMLTTFHAHMCASMRSSHLMALAEECPLLTDVVLGGSAFVRAMPRLRRFAVTHSPDIGTETAAALSEVQQLESVTFESCLSVDDMALARLLGLSEEKAMSAISTSDAESNSAAATVVAAAIAAAAAPGSRLWEVSLNGCEAVTDVGVLPLLAIHGSSLETLNLNGCVQLSPAIMSAIATHCGRRGRGGVGGHLTCLDVRNLVDAVDDLGLSAVAEVCGSSLRKVDLTRCTEVTDTGVMAVLQTCGQLQELRLNSLDKLTVATLEQICNGSHDALEALDLSFCRQVGLSDGWVDRLRASCSALGRLWLWGCIRVTQDCKQMRRPPLEIIGLHTVM
eukprot:UC1_evm1s1791